MNVPKQKGVVNASPLICLGKAGLMDVLLGTYECLIIPQRVIDEIKAGPENDPARLFVEQGRNFMVAPSEVVSDHVIEWDLGAGESAVLDYAVRHSPIVAIIDDAAARRCARTLNVPYCGSVGVVIKAHKMGIIKDLSGVLKALRGAGLYVTEDILGHLQDLL